MITGLGTALTTLEKLLNVGKGKGASIDDILDNKEKREVLYTGGNILKLISPLIIEPKFLITEDLRHHDNLYDIVKVKMDMFASIVTLAFDALIARHGFSQSKTLSLISNSFSTDLGVEIYDPSTVDNKWGLIDPIEEKGKEAKEGQISEGGVVIRTINVNLNYQTDMKNTNERKDGKKIQIENKSGGMVLKLMIRAHVSYVPQSDILSLIRTNGDETSVSSEWHAWRAKIKSIGDVLLARTISKEYKKVKLKDLNSTLADVEERKRLALAKIATDGAIGFGQLYQMIIVSKTMKPAINSAMRGNIDKDKIKNRFLNYTSSLSVTFVDDDWEAISIYLNGLSGVSDIPFKKLSKADKNADLGDIFKLLAQKGI